MVKSLAMIDNGCLAAKALSAGWHMGDVQRLALCEGGESLNVKPCLHGRKIWNRLAFTRASKGDIMIISLIKECLLWLRIIKN